MRRATVIFSILLGLLSLTVEASPELDALNLARRDYEEAQAAYKNEPTNTAVAWKFARACFDLADLVTKSAERAKLAQEGIAAAEGALNREPKSAAAHYYLGMDMGELARTKSLGALKLVSKMEREFKAARELDANFDHAGPDRSLGMLYRDAPVLGSVGSRSKARQCLQRAVELAPDYPDNRLALLEGYVKWGDWNEAQKELKALEEIWPKAQGLYKGEAWTNSWADWDSRLRLSREKVERHAPK
jgi:tetratricopeptide (TPR) repeat protein